MTIQRRVALIGSGEGPWISTKGLREPVAKITGLRAGGLVTIHICKTHPSPENALRHYLEEDGKYLLVEAEWMRVTCVDGGKKVICDILSKKVA